MHKVKACPQFHLLCAGPLKLQREKSTYFGLSRVIVRGTVTKPVLPASVPQPRWEGGCTWWWPLAGRSSQLVTKAALKFPPRGGRWWEISCALLFEHAELTSAVLMDDLASGRHSNSPDMSALARLHLRSRVTPLVQSQIHTTPVEQLGARELTHCDPVGCPQPVASVLGMRSRVLRVVWKPSGREWEIPGCHSLSRHIHTTLQRGLKGF